MTDLDPLESLYFAALERATADRPAYLDEACRDKPELRERVERLLAAKPQIGEFLQPPAATITFSGDREQATVDYPGRDERIGAILAGKYKLIEAIGEGGMGSVFMAQQTQPVKRNVAVKVIKAGMDSKAVLARFEAERQALAMMDHPNIAKVLDAGTTESGRPYFVMELVKGVPITEYCDERKLTPRQRLELFVPVCNAIQHAHMKGVIHRDIKPSNVLVAMYDDKPVPKVIDFGVAKATGASLTDHSLITGHGAVVGTPEYMSPEQANFNNLDIDTRSDVYSLGVLLYELLTGSTPVDRKSLGKAALMEILRIVREVEAPKPSAKLSTIDTLPSVAANRSSEPAKLSKLMRGELDWLVLKALEKDRTRRYESANAFAADVQRFLAGEAVQAHPPSTVYRFRKFLRKNRGPVLAAMLILLALIGGFIGTSWGLLEARWQRDAAVLERDEKEKAREAEEMQRQRAVRSATEAKAVSTFLTDDLLGQADPDKNAQDKHVTIVELLHRAEKRIEGNPMFADRPEIEATLRLTIGKTFFKLGLYPEAERHLRRAVQLRQQVFGLDNLETLVVREAFADFLIRGPERPEEAEPLAKETWAARVRMLGPEHRDTLDSLDTYAQALQSLRRTQDAIALYRQCLDARRRVLGSTDSDTLASMNNLATLLNETGVWNESIPLLKEVFRVRQVRQSNPTDPAITSSNLGIALYMSGDQESADRLIAEQEALSAKSIGDDNPITDRLRGLAVRIWCEQNRLEEAVIRGREVVARRRKIYAPGHPLTGNALLDLGRALALQGKYADAEQVESEALAIYKKSSSQSEYLTGWAEHWRGVALLGLNRWSDAEPMLVSAEQKLRTTPMTPPRHYREALKNLAKLYEKWNKPAEAEKWRAVLAKYPEVASLPRAVN